MKIASKLGMPQIRRKFQNEKKAFNLKVIDIPVFKKSDVNFQPGYPISIVGQPFFEAGKEK